MKKRFNICKRLSGLVAPTPWFGRRGTSVLTPPLRRCFRDGDATSSLCAHFLLSWLYFTCSWEEVVTFFTTRNLTHSWFVVITYKMSNMCFEAPTAWTTSQVWPKLSRAIDLASLGYTALVMYVQNSPSEYFVGVVKVNGEVHLRTGHEGPEGD
jgi:hypothetical protein